MYIAVWPAPDTKLRFNVHSDKKRPHKTCSAVADCIRPVPDTFGPGRAAPGLAQQIASPGPGSGPANSGTEPEAARPGPNAFGRGRMHPPRPHASQPKLNAYIYIYTYIYAYVIMYIYIYMYSVHKMMMS